MRIWVIIINVNSIVSIYFCPSLNAWNNGVFITNYSVLFYTANKFTPYKTFMRK